MGTLILIVFMVIGLIILIGVILEHEKKRATEEKAEGRESGTIDNANDTKGRIEHVEEESSFNPFDTVGTDFGFGGGSGGSDNDYSGGGGDFGGGGSSDSFGGDSGSND